MFVNVKFSEKEVIAAHNAVYLRKNSTRLMLFVTAFLVIVSLLTSFVLKTGNFLQNLPILIPPIILISLNYLLAKSKYLADKRYKENIKYDFQETLMEISGSSFDIKLLWSTINRVIVTNKWIFIQVKSKTVCVIPKDAFFESELLQLKDILRSQSVKNNL